MMRTQHCPLAARQSVFDAAAHSPTVTLTATVPTGVAPLRAKGGKPDTPLPIAPVAPAAPAAPTPNEAAAAPIEAGAPCPQTG